LSNQQKYHHLTIFVLPPVVVSTFPSSLLSVLLPKYLLCVDNMCNLHRKDEMDLIAMLDAIKNKNTKSKLNSSCHNQDRASTNTSTSTSTCSAKSKSLQSSSTTDLSTNKKNTEKITTEKQPKRTVLQFIRNRISRQHS
jgi:hypothetical protein